jgi:hypothetical protein
METWIPAFAGMTAVLWAAARKPANRQIFRSDSRTLLILLGIAPWKGR